MNGGRETNALDAAGLVLALRDARRHTLELFEDLDEEQEIGPEFEIVNPPLWEVGHVAWFHERWVLRHHGGRAALRPGGDELYNSAAVHHPERWRNRLPVRAETLEYLRVVLDSVVERLERLDDADDDESLLYFARLGLFHEDMHVEALLYTRQTLGYAAPAFLAASVPAPPSHPEAEAGDVEVPGGTYMVGAATDSDFVFDAEKWAHPVELEPFAIARLAVSQGEFAAFVADGGYAREELWSRDGWSWRTSVEAEHPLHWRPEGTGAWSRRVFDSRCELEPDLAMIHANAYEAEAFCRWRGRRLPDEAEWEVAAAYSSAGVARPHPWGAGAGAAECAHMDFACGGCAPVQAKPAGDATLGCRQMIGNTWEWTASTLGPYPGFVADPYVEYSQPWFGTHRVLRGGSWATRSRMIRNTSRNFHTPDRRDVWAGFRTCAPREGGGAA